MTRPPDLQAELRKAWRLATAPFRALPEFVIAGAPKCGTSSLYDMITSHSHVRRGARKEPTNFIHFPGSRLRAAMNYPVRSRADAFMVGDGSVEYFTHPDAPANVRAIVPDARLIFLLREPVARAWSDYQMYRAAGTDHGDFAIIARRAMRWLSDASLEPLVDAAAKHAIHPTRYVLRGMYARAIERWLGVFPREQCLFLFTEEFAAQRDETMLKVFAHLGLVPEPIASASRAREGRYTELQPPDVAAELKDFFAPHNARLARLLGCSLPWE